LLGLVLSQSSFSIAADPKQCPGAFAPAPPVLKPDLLALLSALEALKDTTGQGVWKTTPETKKELDQVFESKTKLEQFFQLLFLLQKHIPKNHLPLVVEPPGIIQVLLAAKVFKDPAFPQRITRVELKHDDPNRNPFYTVHFADKEVRFSINEGQGFSSWDQGMCQTATELIFYNGFSFRVRNSRVNRNLVVDDFDQVELYGQFGSRGMFTIDVHYVDLEKVEFIRGTDQGKVKARVAKREFKENKHSGVFKFIGSLIPNTSKQRIDW